MDIVIYMKINIFKHTFLLFWAKCLHWKNKTKKTLMWKIKPPTMYDQVKIQA